MVSPSILLRSSFCCVFSSLPALNQQRNFHETSQKAIAFRLQSPRYPFEPLNEKSFHGDNVPLLRAI